MSMHSPPTKTGKRINPINIHSTTPTNSLSTAPPKRQGRVNLILNPNQRIQHHRPGLVEIQRVRLHLRLTRRLVGVPSVDLERFGFGVFARSGLLDVARFGGGLGWP